MDIIKNKNLLEQTDLIINHSKEITKLKGESFNIYSILKLESAENTTHSAFLGELLSPEGAHQKGKTFLKLFLETIDYTGELDLDKSITVELEKHIGPVNHKKKTGGRLDIFISDGTDSISIENKIFANDQKTQIERYCNYAKRNTVYYLSLFGNDPIEESRGELLQGEDYYIISYNSTIIKWLSLCQKESFDSPILRESIKQYILLIKKLTSQLTDNEMDEKLKSLIYKNLDSAKVISENYINAVSGLKENFRNEIKEFLKKRLNKDFKIQQNNINTGNAYLFLRHKSKNIQIGIETFNGSSHLKTLQIGFWLEPQAVNKEIIQKLINDNVLTRHTSYWYNMKYLGIDFNKTEDLEKLTNEESYKKMVANVCHEIDEYFRFYEKTFYELEEKILTT